MITIISFLIQESYNPYLFSPYGGNSGVIMGEMLVSKKGLGYLIVYGSQIFNLSLVITSIFVLAIISCLLYYLILYLEKKILK